MRQLATGTAANIKVLVTAGAQVNAQNDEGLTPLRFLKERLQPVYSQWKDALAPTIVALVEAGDYSWDAAPVFTPGIGRALYSVWRGKNSEQHLRICYRKLSVSDRQRVVAAWKCLNRFLPSQELKLQIISYALDVLG